LKILTGLVSFVLLIKLLTILFVEPGVRKKIEETLNKKSNDYTFAIHKVHILLITSGIKIDGVTIFSKQEHGGNPDLSGEIASVKFKRIKILKALFKKDIVIREIIISNSRVEGKMPFHEQGKQLVILPLNIHIGKTFIDKTDLSVENTSSSESYSVKEGKIKVYDLNLIKHDTLSKDIIKQFDFEALELVTVMADSMYTYTLRDIAGSSTSNTLSADSFSIHPNYTDYEFTSRHKFQTVRIEAGFSNIFLHDFNPAEYLASGSLISSYVEIRKMDMKVFRDKRKEFRHVSRPAFQDMIYNYPGIIRFDSIGLSNGNVTYKVHGEEANEPGSISFNDISAGIYKITNDTIYKTEKDYLVLKANALLMGKSRLTILLKGRIFESNNTFTLNGTLAGLEANELNPILEKNAFVYITSGKIDNMNFSFTANNTKATGSMTLLYHGLDIAVKNKRTDDTTAFREKFISFIVNKKVSDSNPVGGDGVRVGIIYYERDPERFLFGYCFKSILSGIKSSIVEARK